MAATLVGYRATSETLTVSLRYRSRREQRFSKKRAAAAAAHLTACLDDIKCGLTENGASDR